MIYLNKWGQTMNESILKNEQMKFKIFLMRKEWGVIVGLMMIA